MSFWHSTSVKNNNVASYGPLYLASIILAGLYQIFFTLIER